MPLYDSIMRQVQRYVCVPHAVGKVMARFFHCVHVYVCKQCQWPKLCAIGFRNVLRAVTGSYVSQANLRCIKSTLQLDEWQTVQVGSACYTACTQSCFSAVYCNQWSVTCAEERTFTKCLCNVLCWYDWQCSGVTWFTHKGKLSKWMECDCIHSYAIAFMQML